MRWIQRSVMLFSLFIVMIGCNTGGPTVVPIGGVATRNGKPIKNLYIEFHPADGTRLSWGVTDDQGRFDLEFVRDQPGAQTGKHKVTVAFKAMSPQEEADMATGKFKFHPDKDKIMEKYGTKETTALTVEITRAESDLQLKLD